MSTSSVRRVEAASDERRRAPRTRILKPGLIWCEETQREYICIVVDISETGARLKFTSSTVSADKFELRIEIDKFAADCEVVWRQKNELGLRFVGEPRTLPTSKKSASLRHRFR